MELTLVDSVAGLKQMVRELKKLAFREKTTRRAFAVDTETYTPGNKKKLKKDTLVLNIGRIMFISIAIDDKAWGIPLNSYDPKFLKSAYVMRKLAPVMADSRIRKVMHHANYDVNMFMNHGVKVNNVYCTMIAGHCWNETLPNSLKERCVLVGKRLRRTASVDFTNLKELAIYACDDAITTWLLYLGYELGRKTPAHGNMRLRGIRRRFFTDLEMPVLTAVIEMERRGIKLDRPKLANIDKKIVRKMEALASRLYVKNGAPFNLRSRKQLAAFLFDKVGVESIAETATGQRKVDKLTMAQLQRESVYVRLVTKYNRLESLRRFTSPDTGLHLYCDDNGRIHTTFNQVGARTCRASSSNPNLQQIPSKMDTYGIRTCFIPAKGKVLIVSDKDQLELRLMAIFSKDKMLLRAYRKGISIHFQTGALTGLLPKKAARADLTKEEKDELKKLREYFISKNANFGLQYEGTGFTLWRQLILEGIDSTPEDCEDIKTRYFQIYDGVPIYREWLYDKTREKGYVRNICGRPFIIPNIGSDHFGLRMKAQRQCINTQIQSSGADVIKYAMLAAYRNKRLRELGFYMLLQIHDELMFEGPEENLEEALPIVKQIMEARPPRCIVDMPIELTASVSSGPSWQEAKG